MNNPDSWLQHVKDNHAILSESVAAVRTNWPNIRNIMAEQGVELTPMELQELTTLSEDSLYIIEGDGWKNG